MVAWRSLSVFCCHSPHALGLSPLPRLAGVTCERWALLGANTPETGEVDAGSGHQGGQSCDEVQGLEDGVGGAIAIRGLQPVAVVAVGCERKPLFRYRRPGDVAAQPLQRVPFPGFGRHPGRPVGDGGVCRTLLGKSTRESVTFVSLVTVEV